MPNQQGGKNYKKAKHNSTDSAKFEEAGPGELYGRVIKILGNLNMMVFCNDNYSRICKVCGSMRKRIWINVGDLVIVSIREFEEKEKKEQERGDIIYKYDQSLHSKVKKIQGINQKLFMQLETLDGKVIKEISDKKETSLDTIQDGYEFDSGEAGGASKEEKEAESDSEEEEATGTGTGKKGAKAKHSKHAVVEENDDVNIDDI